MSYRKRSSLWNHFTIINRDRARCDHCSKTISYSGGGTGNLTRHMRSLHRAEFIEKTYIRLSEEKALPTYIIKNIDSDQSIAPSTLNRIEIVQTSSDTPTQHQATESPEQFVIDNFDKSTEPQPSSSNPQKLEVPVSEVPYKIIVKRALNREPKRSKANVRSTASVNKRLVKASTSQSEIQVLDEGVEEMVVKCWATKLRRLAPDQKIFGEKIINDTLFEGALGNLTRHGATFSSRPAQTPSWSSEPRAVYIRDPEEKSDKSSEEGDEESKYDTLYDE